MKIKALDLVKDAETANRNNFIGIRSNLMFLVQPLEFHGVDISNPSVAFYVDRAKESIKLEWQPAEFDI